MKSPLLFLLAGVSVSMLSACSWFERPAPYADSESAPALEVPDGLDKPAPDPALQIPAGKGGVLGAEAQLPPDVDPAAAQVERDSLAPEPLIARCAQVLSDCFARVEEAFDDSGIYRIKLADSVGGTLTVDTEEVTREGRWWLFGAGRRTQKHEFLIQFTAQGEATQIEVMDGSGKATLNPRARVIMDQIKQLLVQ